MIDCQVENSLYNVNLRKNKLEITRKYPNIERYALMIKNLWKNSGFLQLLLIEVSRELC